jgi:hypothetical protein
LLTHIIEDDIDLASDLSLCVIGNADATWFRDAFEPGGYVDAVSEDVVVIEDDIADMNADAEFDPDILRYADVLFGHAVLDFIGTPGRVHYAGEFHQHAVAGGLDDAAAMRGDCGIDERLSERLELGERAFFVPAHQTAIAGDIRRQYCR